MNLVEMIEQEAEMLLKELKARCEHLANVFVANAHSHIDPVVDALQAHVDAKAADAPVEAPVPQIQPPAQQG